MNQSINQSINTNQSIMKSINTHDTTGEDRPVHPNACCCSWCFQKNAHAHYFLSVGTTKRGEKDSKIEIGGCPEVLFQSRNKKLAWSSRMNESEKEGHTPVP
mmetsp:Transcript_20044/g.44920  ORF Transcript_20044/g.44920 Transcript_20044/m.44920 type:complete len:102 (+) Transcript_20044:2-307(+)